MIKFIIEVHSHLFNPVPPLSSIDQRVDKVFQIDVDKAVEEEVISKMLPSTNQRVLSEPEFKPVLCDNHDAAKSN